MFQQNSLENIRHVLAAVGACFQAFINLLPLDQHDGILLILEQSRDDVPGDPIRFVLQAVDSDKSCIQILDLAELRDSSSQFLAGVINDIDQRDRFLGGLFDFKYHQTISGCLYEIQHVIDATCQRINILAIDWGDEGLVQVAKDFMSDGVPDRFNALDLARLALDVVVPLHHLFEQAAAQHPVLASMGQSIWRSSKRNRHKETGMRIVPRSIPRRRYRSADWRRLPGLLEPDISQRAKTVR